MEYIRDKNGKQVGLIRESGANRYLMDTKTGRQIGKYDANTNKTYDYNGNFYANGDRLLSLVRG